MSEINQVLQVAKILHAKGIQPSIALLKGKLGSAVSMPVLIQGLKQFKSLTTTEIDALTIETQDVRDDSNSSNMSEVEQLQQQVSQLQTQMQQLLSRIEKLEREK
ncbi:MAG: hypothetical protein ACPGUD_08765 [Parashewanella sp.]